MAADVVVVVVVVVVGGVAEALAAAAAVEALAAAAAEALAAAASSAAMAAAAAARSDGDPSVGPGTMQPHRSLFGGGWGPRPGVNCLNSWPSAGSPSLAGLQGPVPLATELDPSLTIGHPDGIS